MPRSSPIRSASGSSRSLLKQYDGVFARKIENRQVREAVSRARTRRNARNVLVKLFRNRGPAALADPRVQLLLRRLWDQMHFAPTLKERVDAKDRFIQIVTAPLPNLRQVKEQVDPELLGAAADAALNKLHSVRRQAWHNSENFKIEIKRIFPEWPDRLVELLAKAMVQRNRAEIRKRLFACVGFPFGRGWTTVRSAFAEFRKKHRQGVGRPQPHAE